MLEDRKYGRRKPQAKIENTFWIKFEQASFLAAGLPGCQSLASPVCLSKSQTLRALAADLTLQHQRVFMVF